MSANGTRPPPPAPSASLKPAVNSSLPWSGTMKFFGGAGGGGSEAAFSAGSADAANARQAIADNDVTVRLMVLDPRWRRGSVASVDRRRVGVATRGCRSGNRGTGSGGSGELASFRLRQAFGPRKSGLDFRQVGRKHQRLPERCERVDRASQ